MGMWFEYSGTMAALINNAAWPDDSRRQEVYDELYYQLDELGLKVNYECSLIYEKSTRGRRDIHWDKTDDENYQAFDGTRSKIDQHVTFTSDLLSTATDPAAIDFKGYVNERRRRSKLQKLLTKHKLEINFLQVRTFTAIHYDTVDSPVDMLDIKTFHSAVRGEQIM